MSRFYTISTCAIVALCALSARGVSAQDGAKDVKTDPAAVAMLKEAHDKRETFPAGFGGLTADITVADAAGESKGTLAYSADGKIKLTLAGASTDTTQWATDQLESSFSHRHADDFAKGDGSHPLSFDSDDHSPLGRSIALNDKGNSHYRVKDGHITQVNRSMGPAMKFSITVLADRNLQGGKYLPSQFVVTYFDAAGAIKFVAMGSGFHATTPQAAQPSAPTAPASRPLGPPARPFEPLQPLPRPGGSRARW